MHPDAIQMQDFAPDLGQAFLDKRFRRYIRPGQIRSHVIRRRESAAIQLAIRSQRELRQEDKRHRYHVLRQFLLQPVTQVGYIRRLSRLGHDVRCQLFVARHVFAGHDHTFAHRRMLAQRCFNFSELNAEASNLHLLVQAAEILNFTVRQTSRTVAALVEPASRHFTVRIGDELLSS